MEGGGWKKLLIGVGAAAGAAAVLYYLLKDEPETSQLAAEGPGSSPSQPKTSVNELTKDQVKQILQDIINSQTQMKDYMKDLTKELHSTSLTFDQTYEKIKGVQPNDPLEAYGLSMQDFDQLLDKHQHDPGVRDAIAQIMGASGQPQAAISESARQITVKKIIDVHAYMHEELEVILRQFQSLPNKEAYDLKTVTIAAQAIVGSKVEEKFSITSDEIEGAVLTHHQQLATDQEFATINRKIQQTMGTLMGAQFT